MEYQLRAAVVHEGQSTSSDHFYRLVWSDDDRCIRCDDQRITELRAEEAAQSSAAALTLAEMTGNVWIAFDISHARVHVQYMLI